MKTYGLTGRSGTGKSYQSLGLCRQNGIECIVDDGLIICGNKILGGKSAKRQSTKISAVKTALFVDENHRTEAVQAIKSRNPESILVIGTSEGMIRKIIERLELPPLTRMFRIEDITDEKEREIARKQRQEYGKHVIPVPTFQLKHEFSGYFLDPLKIFRKLGAGRHEITEKSVVRPTYSYLGEYVISEKVIADIVYFITQRTEGIFEVLKAGVANKEKGIEIQVDAVFRYGFNVVSVAKKLQDVIAEEVEKMTAFNVLAVNISIKNLQ